MSRGLHQIEGIFEQPATLKLTNQEGDTLPLFGCISSDCKLGIDKRRLGGSEIGLLH
jgi:hypothetical protein